MKDEFFYQDLIYLVRGLAELQMMDDAEINERIIAREQPQKIIENGHGRFGLSSFSLELMEVVHKVGEKAGINLKRFEDIRFYPEAVLSVISEIEKENKYSLVRN